LGKFSRFIGLIPIIAGRLLEQFIYVFFHVGFGCCVEFRNGFVLGTTAETPIKNSNCKNDNDEINHVSPGNG
jgi:uncharacterized protein YneR